MLFFSSELVALFCSEYVSFQLPDTVFFCQITVLYDLYDYSRSPVGNWKL